MSKTTVGSATVVMPDSVCVGLVGAKMVQTHVFATQALNIRIEINYIHCRYKGVHQPQFCASAKILAHSGF